jgi:hypothetical protein
MNSYGILCTNLYIFFMIFFETIKNIATYKCDRYTRTYIIYLYASPYFDIRHLLYICIVFSNPKYKELLINA